MCLFCFGAKVASNVEIYFAFADGVLTHDCADCTQPCCKTGTIDLFLRERGRLFQMLPATELVTANSTRALANTDLLVTPMTGCWFLTRGRCSLATSYGGALRPVTCTLFPFNRFATHGKTLVVAPNPLCPLTSHREGGVAFGDLEDLLGRLGFAGPPPQPVRAGDPPDALALERLLRDATSSIIAKNDPLALLALSELATLAFMEGGIEALAMLDLKGIDAAKQVVRQHLERDATLLGLSMPSESAWEKTTGVLAAWLPSLRLFAFSTTPLDDVARATSVLALLFAGWCSLRPDRAPLPQTLDGIASTMGPLCRLLARWEDLWTGGPLTELGLTPGEPLARVEPNLASDLVTRRTQLWSIVNASRHGGLS